MSEHPRLEAGEILRGLLDANVHFVLIGGLGALREELDRRA